MYTSTMPPAVQDPEEEELPELWFGNKGPEEEKLQADVQNGKEKKWWQYMLA